MMRGWVARWRWPLLLAALLAAGLAFAFWPQAVAVDAARVSRGPMVVSITDTAVTRAAKKITVVV